MRQDLFNKTNDTSLSPLWPEIFSFEEGILLTIRTYTYCAHCIGDDPPFIICSPDNVLIREGILELNFPPDLNISTLNVIKSKLTEDDINKLINQYQWNLFWENFSWDMWFRFGILSLQIITLPLTIFGIYMNCSQRMDLKILKREKTQKKLNYHENKQFFSQPNSRK